MGLSTLGGRTGRPLTHSSYTTPWDTTTSSCETLRSERAQDAGLLSSALRTSLWAAVGSGKAGAAGCGVSH